MTVAIHNTTVTAGPVSVTSRGVLHTATAGSVLLVWTQVNKANSISNIAINTHNLGRLALVSAGTTTIELWAHTGPASGILTVSAALVGATSGNFAMIVQSFTGARNYGQNPFGTVVAGTAGATTNLNLSISTSATNMVAFGFGVSANTTLTIGGTTDGTATLSTLGRLAVGHIAGGAAAVSVSCVAGASGQLGGLGVPIIASSIDATTLAFDNVAATGTSVAVATFGLLLTATTNACLVVFTNCGGDVTLSSIAINGTPLTPYGNVHYRNDGSAVGECWVMTSPPSGVLTISGACVGVKTGAFEVVALTYTGHKTTGTGPFGTLNVDSASNVASCAISISSTAGNRALAAFCYDAAQSGSVAAGVTLRFQSNSQFPSMIVADVAGAASRTISAGCANVNTPQWGMFGLNLIQSGTQVNASATFTDAPDLFSASGQVKIAALLAATDTADRFSSSAQVRITASMARTDTPDTFSASSQVIIQARLSATEASDIFSASANVIGTLATISAVAAFTDRPDTFSASGFVVVSALFAATDRPDLFSAQVATTSSPPVVVQTQDPGAGGGHGSRASDAYWLAREEYLRSLQPEIAAEPEPEIFPEDDGTAEPPRAQTTPLLLDLRFERLNAVAAVEAAPTIAKLHAAGERLRLINARILDAKRSELQRAIAERDAIRAVIQARRDRRNREMSRLRKQLALLDMARSLLHLQDHT